MPCIRASTRPTLEAMGLVLTALARAASYSASAWALLLRPKPGKEPLLDALRGLGRKGEGPTMQGQQLRLHPVCWAGGSWWGWRRLLLLLLARVLARVLGAPCWCCAGLAPA